MKSAAILIDDGTIIPAKSIGSDEISVGEIVFNTSMTGYQEIITDPSYDRQIITFTNPHIGKVTGEFPDATAPDQLALLLSPGVLSETETDMEALQRATTDAARQCFEGLREQRQQEGEKLAALIQQRSDAMRGHLTTLRQQLPALQAAHRQRLLDRLQSLDIEAEPVRLEEEIVYALQRGDVEEEMDRLDAHLDAIESALETTVPVGRRLDFLMQELNREANTLGSKSTALSTTNVSVEFKVLIEQMREQIQNIE